MLRQRATLSQFEKIVEKNGRTRTIPLNSTVLGALRALHATAKGEYVFVNEDGEPYKSIGSIFKRACKRANISGVAPHTLRHTFASRLVMAGVDLRTVQELGGWQTIAMVERYAHLSPAHKAQAVERIAWSPTSTGTDYISKRTKDPYPGTVVADCQPTSDAGFM